MGAPDSELVQAAQRGDVHAFERLVARHQKGVLQQCHAQVQSRELAEDLMQEAFLRAWLRIHQLRAPYAFGAWVRRVARNLALSEQRRSSNPDRRPITLGEEALTHLEDTEATARQELRLLTEQLRAGIEGLNPERRHLLRLHFAEGLTKQEIARRHGVHPATVGRQMEQAMAALRQGMQGTNPASSPARRIAVIIASVTALSAPGSATAAPPAPALPAIGMLPTFLQGVATMSSAKTLAVTTAAVVLVGGAVLFRHPEFLEGPPPPLPVLQHSLGGSAEFVLRPLQSQTIRIAENPYQIQAVEVLRTNNDELEAAVRLSDGTVRTFKGSIDAGDFVMLGGTNYIESGEVGGTAPALSSDVLLYLAWERETGRTRRFHLRTKTSREFGQGMRELHAKLLAGSMPTRAAEKEGHRLMTTYQMYPEGDVFRRTGKGFVP